MAASLFGDLPPLQAAAGAEQEDAEQAPDDPEHDEAAAHHHDDEPPRKRTRVADAADAAPEPAPATKDAGGDQVAAALARIGSHIASPAKFVKASSLLRKLLDSSGGGGGLARDAHGALLFAALRAAFGDGDGGGSGGSASSSSSSSSSARFDPAAACADPARRRE
jgi:hypothetical protein